MFLGIYKREINKILRDPDIYVKEKMLERLEKLQEEEWD